MKARRRHDTAKCKRVYRTPGWRVCAEFGKKIDSGVARSGETTSRRIRAPARIALTYYIRHRRARDVRNFFTKKSCLVNCTAWQVYLARHREFSPSPGTLLFLQEI